MAAYLPRNAALAAAALSLAALLAGCSFSTGEKGSGTAASERRATAPFDALDVVGEGDVEVRVGPERSVVVRGDDNLLDAIRTRVRAGTLHIETTRDIDPDRRLVVRVTTPNLASVEADGWGTIRLAGLRAPRFHIRADGLSEVIAQGTVGRLRVEGTGMGSIVTEHLATRHVETHLDEFAEIRS